MVLITNFENTMDRTCDKWGNFKGNKNYKETVAKIFKKKTTEIFGIKNNKKKVLANWTQREYIKDDISEESR